MVGLSTSGKRNYRTECLESINNLRILTGLKVYEKKTRACLKCDNKFLSEGQRLCSHCRFENNICYLDTSLIKQNEKLLGAA